MGSLFPESIDVAAGLVFVYLFMSILATIVREAFEGFVKRRARNLEKGLIELLCDQPGDSGGKTKTSKTLAGYDMLKAFYDHPLIMSLYQGRYTIPPKRNFAQGRKLPSYIPSAHFAYVVLDMLAEAGGQSSAGQLDMQTIQSAAANIDNRRLAKMVQFAINNSAGDPEKARQFLETWFNATMDRVSGWYRLETQTILFWVSLVACVALNVNTVVIADSLWRSPSLRKTLEAQAEAYYQGKPSAIDSLQAPSTIAQPVTPQPVAAPAADTASAAATPATPETQGSPASQAAPVQVVSTSVPTAITPPPSELDKAPPAATLVTNGDIPGLLSTTDPLEKLGLPLGWNTQTITAMHRLFPQAPYLTADSQKKIAAGQAAVEQTGMDGKTHKPHKKTALGWINMQFRKLGALWDDTMQAYQNNDQDPTRNALFSLAGTLSLIMGWVMTAFAVTLGAPFWFDILGKLMVVRSTMKPGDKGSSDLSSLSALAASLTGSDKVGVGTTTQTATLTTPYLPNFSSVGTDNSTGDLVNTLDPNSRPRDP